MICMYVTMKNNFQGNTADVIYILVGTYYNASVTTVYILVGNYYNASVTTVYIYIYWWELIMMQV